MLLVRYLLRTNSLSALRFDLLDCCWLLSGGVGLLASEARNIGGRLGIHFYCYCCCLGMPVLSTALDPSYIIAFFLYSEEGATVASPEAVGSNLIGAACCIE